MRHQRFAFAVVAAILLLLFCFVFFAQTAVVVYSWALL